MKYFSVFVTVHVFESLEVVGVSLDLCGDVCGYIRLLLPAHFVIDGGGVSWRRTIVVDRTHKRIYAYGYGLLNVCFGNKRSNAYWWKDQCVSTMFFSCLVPRSTLFGILLPQ